VKLKGNNFGKRSIIFGLAVVIIAVITFIYSKVSTSNTVTPPATIQLSTQNQEPSSTDLITIEENEKNGTLYSIKKQLKNTGDVDISNLSMELMLLEKKKNRMGPFLIVNHLKFGGKTISTKQLIKEGFDLNGDNQISLFELSLKPLPLGNLPVNKVKTLSIECEYLLGLPPFNSHNKKATVVVDIKYKY